MIDINILPYTTSVSGVMILSKFEFILVAAHLSIQPAMLFALHCVIISYIQTVHYHVTELYRVVHLSFVYAWYFLFWKTLSEVLYE